MKKFYRTILRVWKSGMVKAIRLYYITLPLSLFFTLVMTLAGFSAFAFGFSDHISKSFQEKVNMVVYFTRDFDTESIDSIVQKISSRPDVKKIQFHPSEQVLQDFKERHSGEVVILESLKEIGNNPFGSSLVVFAKETDFYQTLSKDIYALGEEYKIGDISPVEDITYEQHKIAIDSFSQMINKAEKIASLLAIVFIVMLLFTLYLALHFVTQSDREEIKVMKLVGASNLLIMGPSIVLSALSGFLGAILSLFILYFSANYITPYTVIFDEFNLLSWYMQYFKIFLISFILFGILAGIIGSFLALQRHLK
jgi:cell division transport system permease protein